MALLCRGKMKWLKSWRLDFDIESYIFERCLVNTLKAQIYEILKIS